MLNGVAFNPSNKLVYVSGVNQFVSPFKSQVFVINGTRIISTITSQGLTCPSDIFFDPTNNYILASNNCGLEDTNTISVISNMNVIRQITMSANPHSSPGGIAYAENKIFVTNSFDNNVSVLNSLSLKMIGSISVGSEPTQIVFDTSNQRLYVTNLGSNDVSVIDPNTLIVVSTIPVGQNPFGVAFSPSTLHIYVSNFGSTIVTVINNLAVINQVKVGHSPAGFAYDSQDKIIYVAHNTIAGYVTLLASTV